MMMFNKSLIGILLLAISVIIPSQIAYSQNGITDEMVAHIHTIVVSDKEPNLGGVNITNSSQTITGKDQILMAIDSMPRGNETEATIIVNDIINSTEIAEGDNLSELKQQVNAMDSGELHIDFIILDHVEDAHQFGSVHSIE